MNIEYIRARITNDATARSTIIEETVAACERLNPTLNAFLQLDGDGARRQVAEPGSVSQGSALDGVPIAIKDNICVRGMQATCGSAILAGYHPQYDATVTQRLRAAGAVIIGKTNCDEFAMGSSNENSAYGVVRNPWDVERVPGGSSGGSAAAVAAGLVPVALGSETGGSVRQPAALCGIVGLKPTYGRISRYGLVAFGSSLDQVGIFATNAADAARTLSVIAGRDPNDSTSADVPVPDYADELTRDIRGARIGIPRALFGEGLDAEVRAKVEATIEAFRTLGAEIVDIELPHASYAIAVYYIIATAEASSNLARYDGIRYGFRAADATSLKKPTAARAIKALARKSNAASCSEPTCSHPATTTPTTARRNRCARICVKITNRRLKLATRYSRRPRRPPPSGSARKPTTRSRCISLTSTLRPPTSSASPASPSPAGCHRKVYPSARNSSVVTGRKARCCD
jgi:aspartyl-tRNA(Asn)/glutamyl-tRNA(Gln) amidotransferase subunit A